MSEILKTCKIRQKNNDAISSEVFTEIFLEWWMCMNTQSQIFRVSLWCDIWNMISFSQWYVCLQKKKQTNIEVNGAFKIAKTSS
jgi:hypothetical protein